jgi:heat shock protein HtpX
MSGTLRTFVLLAVLTAIFVAIGAALGGNLGMVIAFLIACGTNLWTWWQSDRMVLSMHNAQLVSASEAPRLHAMLAELSQRAGMPTPQLYIVHEAQPNAFATGRNPQNSAVALNTGLLDAMSEQEVAGVIAHELGHIKHRDTLLMTVTATIAGAIGMLAHMGFMFGGRRNDGGRNPFGPIGALLLLIVGPIAATIVQLAISRAREYEADRFSAEITGDPRYLAAALQRLEALKPGRIFPTAEAYPASAPLFIINPLSGLRMDGLFQTHPSTGQRIARLLAMQPASPAPIPRGTRNPWG